VLRTTVRRAVLDVVVTSGDNQPYLGLSGKDFTITEDGVPQQLLSLERHDFAVTDYTPPKMPPLPTNLFVDVPPGPERGPLNVILYDALDSRLDDQATGRAQLIKFLRQMPADTRVAIFMMYDRLRLLQGFTSDQQKLIAAVDTRRTWPRPESNTGNPLRGFLEMAQFLNGLPGHKNLIWLSDGFPTAFSLPGFVTGDPSQDPFSQISTDNAAYVETIKKITNLLAYGQTAVYPIDIFGLDADCKAACLAIRTLQHADMDNLARATGGHAFYGTNDIQRAIGEAIAQGGSYYTLSYSSTNKNYDGKLRHVEISVARPGLRLAYRHAYFGIPDDAVRDQKHSAQILFSNLEIGSPLMHDVLFSARVRSIPASPPDAGSARPAEAPNALPKNSPGNTEVKRYRVVYTVPVRQFQPSGDAGPPALEFAVAAFDEDRVLLNGVDQRIDQAPPPPGSPPHAPRPNYMVEQQIDVAGKAVALRVAVRNMKTDQTGTLEIPLPLAPEPNMQAETSGQTVAPSKPNR
jgi:VWFA-related protein